MSLKNIITSIEAATTAIAIAETKLTPDSIFDPVSAADPTPKKRNQVNGNKKQTLYIFTNIIKKKAMPKMCKFYFPTLKNPKLKPKDGA